MPVIDGKYYTLEEIARVEREIEKHEASDDFLTSVIVGALTGSSILGGMVGGSFSGGLIGDLLEDTDDLII